MRSLIGGFFGDSAEASSGGKDVAEPDRKGPMLPSKEDALASASPTSTCMPDASPGAASSPGNDSSSPDGPGVDFDADTTFGAPPGLSSDAKDDEAAAWTSPTAPAQPQLWPSTMSGETLQHMIAGASPKKGIARSPDASPSWDAAPKPMFWPRTLSGDDLEVELARIIASSPPGGPSLPPPPGGAFFLPMPLADAECGGDGSPRNDGNPKAKFAEWPRTMSGDELEELSRAAQEVLAVSAPAQSSSSKVFLSTTPSRNAPSSPAFVQAAPPKLPLRVSEVAAVKAPGLAPLPEESAHLEATKVSIADALPEPELGSEQRPTVGSWGHSVGRCKPCAFFHTKGCNNGVDCTFCHLCGRGEKKRRQREKWQAAREANAASAAQQTTRAPPMPPQFGMPPFCFMPPPPMPGVSPLLSVSPCFGMPAADSSA